MTDSAELTLKTGHVGLNVTQLVDVDRRGMDRGGRDSPSVQDEPLLELDGRLQAVDQPGGIGVHGADELDRDRLVVSNVLLHVLMVRRLGRMCRVRYGC